MENIYDVLRVLVNAARGQLKDDVIAAAHAVIDKLEAAPVPADTGGKKSA
jgi:hypothetical protein